MCEALCPDFIKGEEKPLFDVLIGVECAGFRDTTVSWELVNRHINNSDSRLENLFDGEKEDDFQNGSYFYYRTLDRCPTQQSNILKQIPALVPELTPLVGCPKVCRLLLLSGNPFLIMENCLHIVKDQALSLT